MDEIVELSNGILRAAVRPALGAGLAYFDYIGGSAPQPLFRPEPVAGPVHPFDLAMIILLPWSNRISGGGFSFAGKRHDLLPNVAGDLFPLHGNAFSSHWTVAGRTGDHVLHLQLRSKGPGPFDYSAALTYTLDGATLRLKLAVTNAGDEPLPYGAGFHPWLVRDAETVLTAPATGVWPEDEQHLPAGVAPVAPPPEWDFSAPRILPTGFINNCFTGWTRAATISWPRRGLQLSVDASSELSNYVVYSPGAASDFFCFEPVSHPVDAFNLSGGPEANGLVILEPNAILTVEASFTVRT
ncbi:MAG TPA: aldose 1-epimerase [Reyranella sp.]